MTKPESDVIIENNVRKLYGEGKSTQYRYLNENNFYFLKPNGQKQKREWVIYSAKSNCVYCYLCKLFSSQENTLRSCFNGWKNINRRLKMHQCSKEHFTSMCMLAKRSFNVGRIDKDLIEQIRNEKNSWEEVLRRIVSTV